MKRILLFPGQGSQYVGMGKRLAETYAPAKVLLDRANEVLGFDLADVMFNGPEAALTATEVAQPAIFTVSMMAMAFVKESGIDFDYVAGHSLGESSALCAAGAMTFDEGLAMVRTRGLLMAKAGELKPGAMCAVVGLEREKLDAVVKDASATGIVVPANYNSLTQIVISGAREAVEVAAKLAEAAGARKVVMLPVSGAFHSPFMEFAVSGLREALSKFSFKTPTVPVIVNVDAAPVADAGAYAAFLLQQLTGPVRWVECIQKAMALGCTDALEVGPGKVLMGLARGISRDMKVTPVENPEDLKK